MQFPGHAGTMDKSIWDSYLGDDGWNLDFHFEIDGVETLHFRRWATTSGKLGNHCSMSCGDPWSVKISRGIGELEILPYCA